MFLAIKTVECIIVYQIVMITHGRTIEMDMDKELTQCMYDTGNISRNSDSDIVHCMQRFIWQKIGWSQFNITRKEKHFINSLIGTVHQRRKRQAATSANINNHNMLGQNDFRIRREYRTLSDRERSDFHSAINKMKMSGQYDVFANLHRGTVLYSAYGGPNFFGWHRVYLVLFEEALRRMNPTLSLPYWDSTLDYDMDNPVNSILWSSSFLGNGDGFVISGPFANWTTSVGRLTRNIGTASRLISKQSIRRIMTACRTRDISEPTAVPQFSLELLHGGPHLWVGGQMSGLNTAAHDPIFFLHHAFVDLIWEIFRSRQEQYCGVDPSLDYPNIIGLHSARRTMDGLSSYRNIDGYSSYWTRSVYRYAPTPSCSTWRPHCGSAYLRCDVTRQRCVSVARIERRETNWASVVRARMEESTINIGPRFRAPSSEIRTHDAQLRVTRIANAGPRLDVGSRRTNFARARVEESTINIGPRFRAPPSEMRTQDAQLSIARNWFASSVPRSLESALRARAQEATIDIGPRFAAPPPEPRTQDAMFGRRF